MNFCQFFGIYGVESQKRFKNKIYSYFNIRSNGRIPINVLRDVSNLIAYQLYNDYKGSWAKYPKSRKRYSKLKIEDLEHLYWQNEILSLIKRKFPEELFELQYHSAG